MPNYLQHCYKTTTNRGKVVAVLDEPITTQDHDADAFIVTVSDAVFSGGTAYGDFVRADGVTIPLSGSISGNTATVILAPNCYSVPGRFLLTVKVEASGSKTTYLQVDGYAKASSTDEYAVAGDDSAPIDVILEAAERAEQVLSAVADKAPAIFVDASGDIVTITDGADGMPVQSLITHVEPVQEGEGDPSPNNIRNIIGWNEVSVTGTGKNLFGGETLADRFAAVVTVTRDDEARTISFHASSMSGKVFFTQFKPNTQYTLILYGSNGTAETNLHIRYTNGSVDTPQFAASGEASYAVLVTDAGKSVEALRGSYSSGRTTLYYDRCGIFEGVLTEADFAEYQGKTLTADLPETVYGGTLNWTTGVLTVDRVMLLIADLTWKYVTNFAVPVFRTESAKIIVETKSGVTTLCTCYVRTQQTPNGGMPDLSIYTHANFNGNNSIFVRDDSCTTVEDFIAKVGDQTICMGLVTPYTIQLTPQQMETLKGVNNIWSDAGETTVTYAADTKLYIDQKIAAIAAAIV